MACSHLAYFSVLHLWPHRNHHPLSGCQSLNNWSVVHIIQKILLREHHSLYWGCKHLPWDVTKMRRKKKLHWIFSEFKVRIANDILTSINNIIIILVSQSSQQITELQQTNCNSTSVTDDRKPHGHGWNPGVWGIIYEAGFHSCPGCWESAWPNIKEVILTHQQSQAVGNTAVPHEYTHWRY